MTQRPAEPQTEPERELDVAAVRNGIAFLEANYPIHDEDIFRAMQNLAGAEPVNFAHKETPGKLKGMLNDYLKKKEEKRER